ncbi:MAG: tetratricopeptide repeat protein [Candidatus Omnitrophica bacterium]|nr:tetratricopeptide repeat protein [Candidatus Omnitrophota bacterium]
MIIQQIKWFFSRVAVIYLVIFIFCLTCLDLKTLDERIKVRRLNSAARDFSQLILFEKGLMAKDEKVSWQGYKDYFELILQYVPDDMIAKQFLGYVSYYVGDEARAIKLYKDVAQLGGQDVFWPDYNLGVIYYKKGMWTESAQYLFKAIGANPKLTAFLVQTSIIYRQVSASPYFKYTYGQQLENALEKSYILLLSTLNHLKQYDKMIILANSALGRGLPCKDALYLYLGVGLLEEGQLAQAEQFFQKSLLIEKNNPEVYYYMANIYKTMGRLKEAQNLLEVSLMLHRQNNPRFPYDRSINPRFF